MAIISLSTNNKIYLVRLLKYQNDLCTVEKIVDILLVLNILDSYSHI